MREAVGVVGVGAMGMEMVRHLIERGLRVYATDIDSQRKICEDKGWCYELISKQIATSNKPEGQYDSLDLVAV